MPVSSVSVGGSRASLVGAGAEAGLTALELGKGQSAEMLVL